MIKQKRRKSLELIKGYISTKLHNHPEESDLITNYSFDAFVVGESNQLATASALEVARNPGDSYNPLFIYGDVGLGKTHLMQAVGNTIKEGNPKAKVAYIHSERFASDLIQALQNNRLNEFRSYYGSLDALLIDDIQFISGKERSQEELIHTFDTLLEQKQQVVISCDTFPNGVNNIIGRLKSRLKSGLAVSIDSPTLETRVAILHSKAIQSEINLPDEVALFIAENIHSDIRELVGALSRVDANTQFTGESISLGFAKEVLGEYLDIAGCL